MPKLQAEKSRCSVVGCINPHNSLHRSHASEPLRSAWLNFIFLGNVPTSVGKILLVCSKHFPEESFSNLRQYREGFAERLRLLEGSVPSLYGNDGQNKAGEFSAIQRDPPEPDDSYSPFEGLPPVTRPAEVLPAEFNIPLPSWLNPVKSVLSPSLAPTWTHLNPSSSSWGVAASSPRKSLIFDAPSSNTVSFSTDATCQLDDPLHAASDATQTRRPKASKGSATLVSSASTQLSLGTLKPAIRSKSVQATMRYKDAATEMSPVITWFQLSTAAKKSTSGLGARPAKRPRIEVADEEDEDVPLPHESTHKPAGSVSERTEMSGTEGCRGYDGAKYIVYESCLRELFDTCPVCKHECDVQQRRLGTFVSFSQVCGRCKFSRKWQSQPVRGSTPLGNLHVSAAVYFSGGSFPQMEKICNAMKLQIHPYKTFRRHAQMFLEPSIYHKWKTDQLAMFGELQPHGKVVVGGDVRADSPGNSAKTASYTLMNLGTNKILDVQLVQSNEVGSSVLMEEEGLRRGLDLLESNRLQVDYVVTDRRAKVQTYLEERKVPQQYDVWHLDKELTKKLERVSRSRDGRALRKWLPSIRNNLYWTASSSSAGPEKVAKWKSLVNHIQNVHTHDDPLFPACLHPPRASKHSSKWLQPGSAVLLKVEKLLLNDRVLRDVGKLSRDHQTSAIEAFHRLIPQFAPKNVLYPFIGKLCRLFLAAMHFNENVDGKREVSSEDSSSPATKNGRPPDAAVKTEQTTEYISDLMRLLFEKVFVHPAAFVEEMKKVPVPDYISAPCTV